MRTRAKESVDFKVGAITGGGRVGLARRQWERRDFKHTLRSETTFSTIPFLFYGDGDGAGDMQMKTCDFGRERGRGREALLG